MHPESAGPWALLPCCSRSSICLDFRRPPWQDADNYVFRSEVHALPRSAQRTLSAASALRMLELRVEWSDALGELFGVLSALQHIK